MRKLMLTRQVAFLLLLLGLTTISPRRALAQSAHSGYSLEAGVDYNYVRTNLPAGGCGCFALNGGNGWVAFNFSRNVGIVGEIASQSASNISSTGADLTLHFVLAGPRSTGRTLAGHFHPSFKCSLAEPMPGGSGAPGSSGLPGSANAFSMIAGGGLDNGLTRHIALRAFEADYYLTRFDNGVNDHQNNLRIAAGVILRFGGGN